MVFIFLYPIFNVLISWVISLYLAYVELRKIEFAKEIANVLSESRNHVILNSDGLMVNVKLDDSKKK